MPPPTAESFSSRILLGPALRTQSDCRLVTLVRRGYETAFEEIVRRYGRPLDRFAAGIVGGRSEDVTQDAFSKALLALRGSENEIELRPWLYRIVRNTALNDLRDRPPSAEELGETIPGGLSAAAEAERREEMADLVERLRALPEPQRAAIVMRELEGLSHEEIAAALGVSGGAARQTIHRARTALRDGFGMLIPLPLLRMLADHGAEAAGGTAVAGAGAASAGGGMAMGGLGAGGAVKVGVATALIAGTVGAGVAIQHDRGGHDGAQASPSAASSGSTENTRATAANDSSGDGQGDSNGTRGPGGHGSDDRGADHRGSDDGRHRSGHDGSGDDRGTSGSGPGPGSGHEGDRGPGESGHGGPGPSGGSGSGGSRGDSGPSGSSGHGGSGESPADDGGGSGGGGSSSGPGSGSSGSGGHGSSGSGGSGSVAPPPPVAEPAPSDDGVSSGSGGSGGGSGSGSSGDDS
jgi:RNA polymerase sigma factor (sigma-70 family)